MDVDTTIGYRGFHDLLDSILFTVTTRAFACLQTHSDSTSSLLHGIAMH